VRKHCHGRVRRGRRHPNGSAARRRSSPSSRACRTRLQAPLRAILPRGAGGTAVLAGARRRDRSAMRR